MLTVQEYIANPPAEPVFIKTAWGFQEVGYVRWPDSNPWVVCPKENGGFGISYCVHYGTRLYTAAERKDR